MSIDPLLAFFALGLVARRIGSDLSLPSALYESVTIVLLLAIGLKGGAEISAQPLSDVWWRAAVVVVMGAMLTLVAYPLLRGLVRLGRADAASVAAHYGSVSVGTFAVATAAFGSRGVPFEAFVPLFVVLLEIPAILVGVVLARRGVAQMSMAALVLGVLKSKSVVLLLGGVAVGAALGREGVAPVAPLFVTGFKPVLALFLLEMGLVCGARLDALRGVGARLVFAIAMPLLAAVIGAATGMALDLSVGGTAMLATLAASASYIVAPAAMRLAVPEADPVLSLTAALGVTFPLNVTIGIPLYLELARGFHA